MRINTLRGNTLAEEQEKRAVRLWDSCQGLWWRLCCTCHVKKQTGQSVTEYTPRNHAVFGGSLAVTWFMVWFPKCFTWLFLTLTLGRLVGVKLFGKITACQWSHSHERVSMKELLDFCSLSICKQFITLPVVDRGTVCEGLLSCWLLLIFDVKCINRSTWYLLAHLYGIGTTPCNCLGIVELPRVEGLGVLQSQAAPWSKEQQGCFSSATFVLPLWAGDGTCCRHCDASTLVKYLQFVY